MSAAHDFCKCCALASLFACGLPRLVASKASVIAERANIIRQSEASTQNKWVLTHLVRCTDTACHICLLCPLRLMSANALRLRLSLLAVSRTESELRKNAPCEVSHASLDVRKKRKNTNKVRAYLFVVRSPRLELGRCNHTPLKRTRLPIPP